MVSVSVRRNPGEPVGRNARASYPHPENPGLIEQVDGYYDWADRRLFLADGSPDPATSGAYRYQTRPDLCDLAAPTSDPASPHYEPPHLRHRPGDIWEIGGKPRDPDDPGTFGSPGWRPDPRTGRHRRDELPDPIPPWEQAEAKGTNPKDAEPNDASAKSDAEQPGAWRGGSRDDGGESGGQGGGGGSQRGGGNRGGGVGSGGGPGGTGGNLRIVPDYRSTASRKRTRFWSDDDRGDESGESGQADCVATHEEPYRFEKLREDAWDRFIIKSSELSAAHWADRRTLGCQHRWLVEVVLRLFRLVIAVFKDRNENEAPTLDPARRPAVPRQAQPQADRSPQPAQPGQVREDSRRAAQEARPVPGAQMAQAIRSVQAARVRLAGTAREAAQPDRADRGDEQADRAARGAAHWRGRPREERPRPSPLPYIARWEQAFDAHRAFGEVAVL